MTTWKIQIPDLYRSVTSASLVTSIYKSKLVTIFYESGNHGTNADPRISQRGLSKDGCSYVVSKIQLLLEKADALNTEESITANTRAVIKTDIAKFFPSIDRQVLFDMHSGKASRDYPPFRKGDRLPTSPILTAMLPLISVLYGHATPMHSYHNDRTMIEVNFSAGVVQGCQHGQVLPSPAPSKHHNEPQG